MGKSGYTCVRYIFCYLNIILWLSACGLLGVGCWLYLSHNGYATLLPQYALLGADSLLITAGAALFAVTFLGCCGSWCQSRCLLITYFTLVIVLFLSEFLLATVALIFKKELHSTMKDELQAGIREHYLNPPGNGMEVVWDHIQTEFHCCGVTDYVDWHNIKAWPADKFVPDSCCKEEFRNITGCGRDHGATDLKLYRDGCSEKVQMWFVRRLHVVGIVGLVVSFIQLFGLVSSMLLFCSVRHKRTSHTYKSYDTAS